MKRRLRQKHLPIWVILGAALAFFLLLVIQNLPEPVYEEFHPGSGSGTGTAGVGK